jgi:hypothetical protein
MCLSHYEVAHGLSLCEAEASVGDGSQSEFARVGGSSAEEEERIENTQEQRRGAMTTYLYDIFACVGMRGFEESN